MSRTILTPVSSNRSVSSAASSVVASMPVARPMGPFLGRFTTATDLIQDMSSDYEQSKKISEEKMDLLISTFKTLLKSFDGEDIVDRPEVKDALDDFDATLTPFIIAICPLAELVYVKNTPPLLSKFKYVTLTTVLTFFRHIFREMRHVHLCTSRKRHLTDHIKRFVNMTKNIHDALIPKEVNIMIDNEHVNFQYAVDIWWGVLTTCSCMSVDSEDMRQLQGTLSYLTTMILHMMFQDEQDVEIKWLNLNDIHIPPPTAEVIMMLQFSVERSWVNNAMALANLKENGKPVTEKAFLLQQGFEVSDDDPFLVKSTYMVVNYQQMHRHYTGELIPHLDMDKRLREVWLTLCDVCETMGEFSPVQIQEYQKRVFQINTAAGMEAGYNKLFREIKTPITIAERSLIPKVCDICKYFCALPITRLLRGHMQPDILLFKDVDDDDIDTLKPMMPDNGGFEHTDLFYRRCCILAFALLLNKVVAGSGLKSTYFWDNHVSFLPGESPDELSPEKLNPCSIIFSCNRFHYTTIYGKIICVEGNDPSVFVDLFIREVFNSDSEFAKPIAIQFIKTHGEYES